MKTYPDIVEFFERESKKYYPFMNPTPQAVTERYVSNLITNGRNKEFDIDMIVRRTTLVDGEVVGYYFSVKLINVRLAEEQNTSGATISQAVRRALEKYGVTFR